MKQYLYVRQGNINDNLKDLIFENLLEKGNEIIEHLQDKNGINGSGSRSRDASEEVNRFFQKTKQKHVYGIERENRMKLLEMKQAELDDAIAIPIGTRPTIPGAYGSSKQLEPPFPFSKLDELELWRAIIMRGAIHQIK
ncbi:unnamed protein product [Dovyalis caffra]|uniref:Uncharacterized protein n=1 Tax=Dovyalis caffra TaxID=77055 RepID=A0AAV1SU25_9ROSI|nr:unnamed protein product [Dovyalis caffra]